jgi:hypothetical protein
MGLTNPPKAQKVLGKIEFSNNQISVSGHPLYELPEIISPEFIMKWAETGPMDDMFIGELSRFIDKQSKRRLRDTAFGLRTSHREAWDAYKSVAMKYAPVTNPDNVWHLEDFTPVYIAEVGHAWVDHVILTSVNMRFVRSSRGVFTFPEFAWLYGTDIVGCIKERIDAETNRLTHILETIQSDLIERQASIINAEGKVQTIKLSGPENIPVANWLLPKGSTFLGIVDTET